MLNKRDMQSYISRMLKGKVKQEPEMRDGQLTVFTSAYNCFSSMSSQYSGKIVYKGGYRIDSKSECAPRNCEIYDLRIGVVVNADGWIDGEIIVKTDCVYIDQDMIAATPHGISPLQLAITTASKTTFTAIDGKDSFEMRTVYPKICKTAPCAPGEYSTINLAGVSTVDNTPNPYLNKPVETVYVLRVVDHKYNLKDWVFNPFFVTLVENGIEDADDFTESDLFGQILADQSGKPVSAIIYASDRSVTFDANILGHCIGAAKSFTAIAYDVGIVEVQFEHGVEYVGETTGDYEMARFDYIGSSTSDDADMRYNIKEFEERFSEAFGDKDNGGVNKD